MKRLIQGLSVALSAALAGMGLSLSMAPYAFHGLAFVSIILLLSLVHLSKSLQNRCHHLGIYYGIGVYGVGIYWLYYALHRFGYMNIPLTLVTLGGFILLLSLLFFWPLTIYLSRIGSESNNWHHRLVIFPTLWVGLEIIKSKLVTGFPWLLLGTSQMGWPLSGFAPILGVYGVSWAVALTAALSVECFYQKKTQTRFILLLFIIALFSSGQLLRSVHWTHADRSQPITVRLLQPNLSIQDKWNPRYLPTLLKQYNQLLDPMGADLIILPEGAIPTIHDPLTQAWLKQVNAQAKHHRSTVIIGGLSIGPSQKIYNSMLVVGASRGHYRKHHLVPFGEFMPFPDALHSLYQEFQIPMATLSAAPFNEPLPRIHGITFTPSICYEIAYPFETAEKTLESKGQIMVILSEDGWFGPSIEPAQHLQIAQMRSLENGKVSVLSTNQGYSAIIAANGDVLKKTQRYQKQTLSATVYPTNGNTPWTQWGHLAIIWIILILIIVPVPLNILWVSRNKKCIAFFRRTDEP